MKAKKAKLDSRYYKLQPTWSALTVDLGPDWLGKELELKARLQEKQKELKAYLMIQKLGTHRFTPIVRFSTKGMGWAVVEVPLKTMDRIAQSWLQMRKGSKQFRFRKRVNNG